MPIIDASVVVDWVVPDADPNGPARRLLRALAAADAQLAAPRLMWEEVSNALLTGVRRGRWDGAAADECYSLLRAMPVEAVDSDRDLDQVWDLARRYDEHPVYDMVYLAVAERMGEPLITADLRLQARVAGSRPVMTPEEWLRGIESD